MSLKLMLAVKVSPHSLGLFVMCCHHCYSLLVWLNHVHVVVVCGGVGLGADYLMTLRAPPKRRLATHQKTLPTITESVKMEQAPPSPKLAALPPQFLPREVSGLMC